MPKAKETTAIQLAEDHRALQQYMGNIKLIVMKEVAVSEFLNWRQEFLWQLDDFKTRLLKHFEFEEKGGFMTDVLKRAPQDQRRAKELKKQHIVIGNALEEILDGLKRMTEKDPKELERIRIEVNEIITSLLQHEEEERRLMQRAYHRDYGDAS